MNSQDVFAQFHNQIRDLAAIADSIPVRTDTAGRPSDALAFAETLLLCPTEDAAKSQMRRDQIGAASFFQIASYVEDKFGDLDIPTGKHNVTNSAPFFVVGSCVQDYLQWLKKSVVEDWK